MPKAWTDEDWAKMTDDDLIEAYWSSDMLRPNEIDRLAEELKRRGLDPDREAAP